MGTLPTSSRVQVIHEIGVKIDDALEKAQLDTARREGAHEAYKSAASSLTALLQQVDKEHAGRDAEVAKAWINRVVTIFKNVSDNTKEQVQIARGAEKQTRVMVDMLKQMYDVESKTVSPAAATTSPAQSAPVPKLIPASAPPAQSAPAANVAPVQAPKPVVAAPPSPPPAPLKPAPAPPSSTTPGTTPRMPVKNPAPPAPPPPPPPPPAPVLETKKAGRKPKKESKQPDPPPPPAAPPKRTRPISIKERRNKGME